MEHKISNAENSVEAATFFQSLSRQTLEVSAKLVKQARANATGWVDDIAPNTVNKLGRDIPVEVLTEMTSLLNGELTDLEPYREAQLRELAFWRWVAYEGYVHLPPELFPLHQHHFMISSYLNSGWQINRFSEKRIFELGCGPLGMIEYLPAKSKVAFDPLNERYSELFANYRNPEIRYLWDKQTLIDDDTRCDLAICHNVIDHTDDPAWWYNTMFDKLEDGGEFLFQVNLSEPDVPQEEDHKRMHPSPVKYEQADAWLKAKSDDYSFTRSDQPSTDGEFYFLAWGRKTKNDQITYENLLV